LAECHELALHLSGLLEAMDSQAHLLPQRALPVHSLIYAARPLAQRLADGLAIEMDRDPPEAAPFRPAARGHTAEEAQIGAIAAELGLFVRREADGYALARTPEAGV
jgi:hypothetical protein